MDSEALRNSNCNARRAGGIRAKLDLARTGEGVRFGRKPKRTGHQIAEAKARREAGEALTDIWRSYSVTVRFPDCRPRLWSCPQNERIAPVRPGTDRATTVRSLSNTAGKLFVTIERARRGKAVLADTTLPRKPLCTIRAGPSAGYIRFRTASRQRATAASCGRSAERSDSTLCPGLIYKRVRLGAETCGEVRATNRTRLGFFCNGEYDRCGGTECYDG
jgi:hypothetical protein